MELIQTNLNPKYYILVKETLRDYGKKIAKAKAEKDVDAVIELIVSSKNTKRTFQGIVANAKKYKINSDGSFLCWL